MTILFLSVVIPHWILLYHNKQIGAISITHV